MFCQQHLQQLRQPVALAVEVATVLFLDRRLQASSVTLIAAVVAAAATTRTRVVVCRDVNADVVQEVVLCRAVLEHTWSGWV